MHCGRQVKSNTHIHILLLRQWTLDMDKKWRNRDCETMSKTLNVIKEWSEARSLGVCLWLCIWLQLKLRRNSNTLERYESSGNICLVIFKHQLCRTRAYCNQTKTKDHRKEEETPAICPENIFYTHNVHIIVCWMPVMATKRWQCFKQQMIFFFAVVIVLDILFLSQIEKENKKDENLYCIIALGTLDIAYYYVQCWRWQPARSSTVYANHTYNLCDVYIEHIRSDWVLNTFFTGCVCDTVLHFICDFIIVWLYR